MGGVATDEQLAAEAAREGSDGPAFRELLDRYRQRVWRICFRLLGNEEDASDAAQEVFVRLFTARAKFAGRSKYATWVHAMAVNVSLTIRRGRGRRLRRVAPTGQETLEQHADAGQPAQSSEAKSVDTSIDLEQMLEILSEEERAMLIMKYVEGHQFDELAEMFGLSQSACKMRVRRACEKIRQRFPDAGV